jgi:long-subunit acyl-CoA synthetase (AMP-forming)/GNAT superfamily N-acetyltransferase
MISDSQRTATPTESLPEKVADWQRWAGQLAQLYQSVRSGEEESEERLAEAIQRLLQALAASPPFEDETLLQLTATLVEILNDPVVGKDLRTQVDLAALHTLSQNLLAAFRSATAESKEALRTVVHELLDVLRRSEIRRRIVAARAVEEWWQMILTLLEETNFATPQLFHQRARRYGHRTLFRIVRSHGIEDRSWLQTVQAVEQVAKGLLALLSDQESQGPVAILSENRIEMVMADLACLTTGIVDVLIPANSVPSQVEYILNDSKARIVLASTEAQLSKILRNRVRLPHLQKIVLMDRPTGQSDLGVISFEQLLRQGERFRDEDVRQRTAQVGMRDLATIMYTSGTTGTPKGIMFNHLNIVSKRFARGLALPEIDEEDVFLCYLPLYHTFGRYFEMMGSIFWGATYAFMADPSVDTMIDNMRRVRPTVFISIPKKWSQLYERIGQEVDLEEADGQAITVAVRRLTGGRLRWGLSAAGYLAPEIFRFFQRHGIELMSGFGMTEATGGITMTPPGDYQEGSVGKALPGIEIRLDKDGEMLIRGPYVATGYWGPAASDKAFQDGWFRTGDVFTRDRRGHYRMVDRKKEIYKNVKGQTIAPQRIENLFRDFESVQHVFLVGDGREFNTVLIYPNFDYQKANLRELSPAQLREFYSALIVSVNRFLAPFERVVDFAIIDRPFSAEKGELTPKGSYKRKVVEKNFADIIEPMYSKAYLALHVGGTEVRLPNWFLREKGLTGDDFEATPKGLVLRATEAELPITFDPDQPGQIQIGDFLYTLPHGLVWLGDILGNPYLWVGNLAIERFAGQDIFRWSRRSEHFPVKTRLLSAKPATPATPEVTARFQELRSQGELSLLGVHLAAKLLFATQPEAEEAVSYLESIHKEGPEDLSRLARAVLRRAVDVSFPEIRRRALQALLPAKDKDELTHLLELFLDRDASVLDEETIALICDQGLSTPQLQGVFDLMEHLAHDESELDDRRREQMNALFRLLTEYGTSHPTSYKRIRAEFVSWTLYEENPEVAETAKAAKEMLLHGFRSWLGPNQRVAVDPETGQEYRWDDVITFEEGMDPSDRTRLLEAIKQTAIVREAVFLFSEGTLLRLQDIPPGGIWISELGHRHGKSVYRVSVQTRHLGAYDIGVNLNQTLAQEEVDSEITWLILASAEHGGHRLVEDFGGYWPEYDMWSEEFIPGETVDRFVRRIDRYLDAEWQERMKQLWPHLVWSALEAYVDFWNRTGRRWTLVDPSPANVIVPSHDYQVGARIVSITGRAPFTSVAQMITAFHRDFVDAIEQAYPLLQGVCKWSVIFAAFVEVLGEREGLRLLRQALEEGATTKEAWTEPLVKFVEAVERKGFLPRRLFFAIRRYHRWLRLNPEATPQARARTLQELYITYNLSETEQRYPASRTRFFRETVFANASGELARRLDLLIEAQRQRPLTEEEFLDRIAELRGTADLSEEEEFFLARMTYRHLQPTDAAELISLEAEGVQKTDLVVYFQDSTGQTLSVRHPVNPKEIVRLHRLFRFANLPVEFRPEHQYLVAVDDRGLVIGGLFYRQADAHTVHMEKIVVAERHRKKGVSDALMTEFFNRLRSRGIRAVTTGFFRPEYFYRFGFRIEKRYAGLVKELTDKRPSPAAAPSLPTDNALPPDF